MSALWKLLAAGAVACVPVIAAAQAPYHVQGLHTDLVFAAAVAQVEKLGGKCRAVSAHEGGLEEHCEFSPAEKAPAIAGQTLLRVSLEAPDEKAVLSRIIILFDGTVDPVKAELTREFGAPTNPGASPDEQSWSHSRRVSWSQGIYRMGLLNSPNLIILAADRSSPQ